MTFSARSGTPRRGRRTRAQLIPGTLIFLGLLATGFLVFSDSVELLRLGLMAAVWAAVIAAFALTRYRRESDLDKSKVDDLQTVYRLQLEREISARREYELGVEARVRREVSIEAEELAGLRTELAALRRNLEVLFEGGLPAERIALHTESTRIAELTASRASAAGSYPDDQPGARTPAPAYGTHEAVAPRFASPFDDPVTAETAAIELDEPVAVSTDEPIADSTEDVPAATAEETGPAAEETAGAHEGMVDQPPEPPTPEPPTPESVPADEPVSRRRRRAVDNDDLGPGTTGLSVAQILASLAAEKADAQHTPD
jgi:hypothetical protein